MQTLAAFWSQLLYVISNIRIFDLIDIAIIAFIVITIIRHKKKCEGSSAIGTTQSGYLTKGMSDGR